MQTNFNKIALIGDKWLHTMKFSLQSLRNMDFKLGFKLGLKGFLQLVSNAVNWYPLNYILVCTSSINSGCGGYANNQSKKGYRTGGCRSGLNPAVGKNLSFSKKILFNKKYILKNLSFFLLKRLKFKKSNLYDCRIEPCMKYISGKIYRLIWPLDDVRDKSWMRTKVI